MPILVLPIARNVDKPGWRTWFTEWRYPGNGAPSFESNHEDALKLFNFHRANHLSSTTLLGVAMIDEQSKAGWFFWFRHESKQGEWPQTVVPLYRYQLEIDFLTSSGRKRSKWLRGCVDGADFIRGRRDTMQHTKYRERAAILDNVLSGYNPVMSNTLIAAPSVGVGVPSVGYDFAEGIQIGSIIDSHAATRWRKRTSGKGPDFGDQIATTLAGMAKQFEINYEYLLLHRQTIHNEQYHRTTAFFAVVESLGKDITKWATGEGAGGETGGPIPNSRFGWTFDEIGSKLKTTGETARKEREKLDEDLNHYTTGVGDQWRDADNFEPFHEQLKKCIVDCTFALYADWYNPNATPEQTPESSYEGKFDAEELLL